MYTCTSNFTDMTIFLVLTGWRALRKSPYITRLTERVTLANCGRLTCCKSLSVTDEPAKINSAKKNLQSCP